MQTETFTYDAATQSWSVASLPQLDSPDTFILVFGSSHFYDIPQPIQDLYQQYPQSHIIGCSTSGEIHAGAILDDSLSVAVTKLEKTTLKSITLPLQSNSDIGDVTEQLAQCLEAPSLRGVFLLGSGLNINFASLIKKLQTRLGDEVIITGGVSGDGQKFERTWVLADGIPTENSVSVIGFYGDAIQIGYGSQGGWEATGLPMLITKAKDNVLYKLNGLSALNWYRFQMREKDVPLPAGALYHPLAIRPSVYSRDFVVRTILGIDEENGGLIFAGEIPERSFAQFMTATKTQLVNGARSAANVTNHKATNSDDVLSVAVSCVGRRLVMQDTTPLELQAVLDILPSKTKQVGFYSYGEICPNYNSLDTASALHNQTMTLTIFSEK